MTGVTTVLRWLEPAWPFRMVALVHRAYRLIPSLSGPRGFSCIVAAVATALLATRAPAQDLETTKREIRIDAIRLMGASLKIPGVAAYCEKYVESNPRLVEAAKAWNERHHELFLKILRTIEWSGGMSTAERELYDRFAYKLLKSEFDEEPDKAAYCRETLAAIESGDMDLDKSPVTADAARRIMAATLK